MSGIGADLLEDCSMHVDHGNLDKAGRDSKSQKIHFPYILLRSSPK